MLPKVAQDLPRCLQELPQQSVQGPGSLLLDTLGAKSDRNGLNWQVLAFPAARLGTAQPCGTGRAAGAFPQSWCHG